jgi:peptidyl-tRNA hydrolase, PTH1 family
MWKKIKEKFSNNPKEEVDYLFVGLGNPGEKYKNTLHNSGFRVASLLREEIGLPDFSKDNTLNSLITKGIYEDKKIVIVLPLTYMNLSGGAVKRATKRFDVNTENIILIHDDTDLPQKTVRFSVSRGSAGHKGVSSVMKSIKTKDITRIRIGVRKEEGKAISVVLKKISSEIEETEKMIVEKIKESITSGFSTETLKR